MKLSDRETKFLAGLLAQALRNAGLNTGASFHGLAWPELERLRARISDAVIKMSMEAPLE